jgi:hypothetical protein
VDTPLAINETGVITGRACDEQESNCWAVLWDHDHNVSNLETLIDHDDPAHGLVHLETAVAINAHGEIAANGCWIGGAKNGQCHPFLLSPIAAIARP